MLFADETTANAVLVSAIGAFVTVAGIAQGAFQAWLTYKAKRDLRAEIRDSSDKAAVAAGEAKETAATAAQTAQEVKTAVIVNTLSTAGKIDEVKTTLAKKAEINAQTQQIVAEVSQKLDQTTEKLEQNTAVTVETNRLANGRTDALLAECDRLKKILAAAGIDPDRPC